MSLVGGKKREKALQELLLNQDFINDIEEISSTLEIPVRVRNPKDKSKEVQGERALWEAVLIRDENYKNKIEKIIEKYQLHPGITEHIVELILYGKSWVKAQNFYIYFTKDNVGGKNKNRLLVEILGNTTPDDLRKDWKEIKNYQEQLPDYDERKFEPYKNFKLILEISRLREGGKTFRQIAEIISEKLPGNDVIGYPEVQKIYYLIKKKQNKKP